VFRGTGREAAFVPSSEERGHLTALYRTITQAGVDLQYTHDAWLWKAEAIVRKGEGLGPASAARGAKTSGSPRTVETWWQYVA
jgi:hypothetical protein